MKRRNICALLLILAVVLALPLAVAAETFPSKPLTYIVCFNPGGESDLTARIQEAPLKKYFGQDVIVSYKIGGGGSVGWSELIQSKPDGYTIAGDNLPHIILQPLTRGNAGYETLDLQQVYMFESTPNILVVRQDSEFKTLQDLLDYAKEHPGVVTAGGSGSSSANELGVIMLNKAAGVKLTYIPFSGSGAATPALLGGHVGALMTYSTMAIRYKDKFRPLAIMSDKRMSVLADVPTFKELGYDLVEGAYRGVAAPPGTPDDRIKYLADTFDKVMKDPEVVKKMDENGFKIEAMGPQEATDFVKKKMAEYKVLMAEMGLIKK
ncbi:Bug family tripartite tricarboxylate transporter substrate binding protein [Pelobacter seleniigenes]|uniref:Bug family tripartite tricarboxylate transporter substrate binding protein n=1 Tax=Pelobacter seleniigenes TaxID=407188 RepID=UPI0004A714E1|nr:tripartite tricarboxylate transporter substrate binding protein [Pelobacter seleniigenes]